MTIAFRLAQIDLFERPVVLRLPFRFGVVTLTQCPQAFVRVRIDLPNGKSAWGSAAELMAPKWFDKNLALSNDDNFDQLRKVLVWARDAYLADPARATAFGHFARHHHAHRILCQQADLNPLLASYGPALIDRAVMDALCRATGQSFYAAMQANAPGIGPEMPEFAGLDFDAFLRQRQPAAQIEARHTVGLVDAITADDLNAAGQIRVNDGLPITLQDVVNTYGHRYYKLKVSGQLAADVDRLRAIARVLDRLPEPYAVSLDGNEQYADVQGVAELLAHMQATPALARLYQSILFVEQPVNRKQALDIDWTPAALGKPVIIDESDGELDTFVLARAKGYAGVSSKTCKGFYKSVLNAARCAAWNAQAKGTRYFMSGEDLTTQAGLSVQQDLALVNLLGIRHVERNGHHYVNGMAALTVPEQQAFLAAHPDVYEQSHGAVRLRIQAGKIQLKSLDTPGFASGAQPDFSAMQPM
jgi:hypothetical protein